MALGLGVAACLTALAFLTAGNLSDNTWVEIVLTLLGAGACAAGVLLTAPGRLWGGVTLSLFVALVVLTGVSIAWSVQPDDSWQAANQTLSYLAAFSGAIAIARIAPERWRSLVGGVAAFAVILSGWALLVKVFPATLDPGETLGRLRAPTGYWNATGLVAALGLVPCLWAGARVDRGRLMRALSVPASAILVAVIVLSYSRGAVLVAVVGVGCWFAIVPLRLRSAAMLALGGIGGGAIAGWALATRALSNDMVPLAARTTAGHAFGLVLLVALALLLAAGVASAFAIDRVAPTPALRRRIGTVLVVLVALVPIAGVLAVARSSRGLTGEVSHVWSTLTNPAVTVSDNPGRLVELSNSRPRYWREGLTVGEHALLKGVGALGYATARARYTSDPLNVGHAHSYVIETFADLGLIGVGVSLALLLAWAASAARAIGGWTRWRSLRAPAAGERAGLLALVVVVVVFGLHSAIDWTWFVPGTALPALLCAGWLAGRGPLAAPVGRSTRRTPLIQRPGAAAALAVLSAVSLAAAWMIAQPMRAASADAAAIAALERGDMRAAIADARTASSRDPVSVEPLFELSALYGALGDQPSAYAELQRAITLQPANPATWQQLGDYELGQHHPRPALAALGTALRLDLHSLAARSDIARARAELGARP